MRSLSRDTTVYVIIAARGQKPSCYFHPYDLHPRPNISSLLFCFGLVVAGVVRVASIFAPMQRELLPFSVLIFGADRTKPQHPSLELI